MIRIRQPAVSLQRRRAGTSPARKTDDLPLPDAPTTARNLSPSPGRARVGARADEPGRQLFAPEEQSGIGLFEIAQPLERRLSRRGIRLASSCLGQLDEAARQGGFIAQIQRRHETRCHRRHIGKAAVGLQVADLGSLCPRQSKSRW
jgi:hypothetical protein